MFAYRQPLKGQSVVRQARENKIVTNSPTSRNECRQRDREGEQVARQTGVTGGEKNWQDRHRERQGEQATRQAGGTGIETDMRYRRQGIQAD
jgi:hypothetical protein